jgi:divinyl protochlorophyllide a 8-vinyl-reductase
MQHVASSIGRIGPNAISQLAAVLGDQAGAAPVQRLFQAAGMAHYLDAMPKEMVDEQEVRVLHATLRRQFGPACAQALARAAGRRTAAYLLEHRIPKPVQWLLKRLPKPLAVRLLLKAIERNSWTFAGSGAFVAVHGSPARLGITHNPLCRGLKSEEPACDFYAGTFEALFRALINPEAKVREVTCESMGDAACVFELDW